MLSLRAEIAACLFAVALLGLLAGWMMQRARSARRLRETVDSWERRYAELQTSAEQDAENLEERLQSLAGELRTLNTENRSLREASRGGEQTLDSARAEAIELNRRQVEAQERLQRIIREREREIAALRSGKDPRDTVVALPDVRSAPREDIVAAVDGLDETVRIDPARLAGLAANGATRDDGTAPGGGSVVERMIPDGDDALEDTASDDDTIPGDVPADTAVPDTGLADGVAASEETAPDDATLPEPAPAATVSEEMPPDDDVALDEATHEDDGTIPEHVPAGATPFDGMPSGDNASGGRTMADRLDELRAGVPDTSGGADASFDETLESTVDIGMLDAEEETVALDDETLALVRGIGHGGRDG